MEAAQTRLSLHMLEIKYRGSYVKWALLDHGVAKIISALSRNRNVSSYTECLLYNELYAQHAWPHIHI